MYHTSLTGKKDGLSRGREEEDTWNEIGRSLLDIKRHLKTHEVAKKPTGQSREEEWGDVTCNMYCSSPPVGSH